MATIKSVKVIDGRPKKPEIGTYLRPITNSKDCFNLPLDFININKEEIKKYEGKFFEIEYEKESIEDIGYGDGYYFIQDDGNIDCNIWLGYEVDYYRYKTGNIYCTYEKAEKNIGVNYKKIVEEIEKIAKVQTNENIDSGKIINILHTIKTHKGEK